MVLYAHLDLSIDSPLLVIKLIVVVGVHLQVVERKLLLDALLKGLALLEGQRVGLGNHRDHIDNVGELLQNHNINRLEAI